MKRLANVDPARGEDGLARGNPSSPRVGDPAVDAARAAGVEMVRVLVEIARGGGLKPASPYVRARYAAAALEAGGYLRSSSVPEAAPGSDVS
ncbi:MAG: hypothetical protein M0002_18840 [Rhodospirillales bacterium]|nr:hypothetical protein [Rhodospirillales bacterium]